MRQKIIPITDLRKTNELIDSLKDDRPIYITKNGYLEAVIMSTNCYDNLDNSSVQDNNVIKNIHLNQNNYPLSYNDRLINVAACSLNLKIGDVEYNVSIIKSKLLEAKEKQVEIVCFPELSLSGYTAGDLFNSPSLLHNVKKGLLDLKEFSRDLDIIFFVGAPLTHNNSLYNCSVCFYKGKILGIVPKKYIPNYQEFYEGRYFKDYEKENDYLIFDGDNIPFGTKILFQNDLNHHEILASEICEDGWAIFSPSSLDANMGATIIFNLSASNETLNKESTRRTLVSEASRKLCASYVYTSASFEESTTDLLFSGHNIISECGDILEESPLFEPSMIVQSIDLERIINRRRNQNTFFNDNLNGFIYVHYQAPRAERKKKIYRTLSKFPFVYNDFSLKMVNLDKVIKMQSLALARRLKAINCDKVVLGLSGGLDSTLAFLVIQETFAFLKFDSKNIHVITMPCFGTSKRTHQNALKLAEAFNNTFKEINISDEVNLHLNDIGHDEHHFDTTYENSQARIRTLILMDYANKIGGIVVGTGDLSEIALGWSTYNGDHMSMYSINASIPKTLIRAMFAHFASLEKYKDIRDVLLDVLDTPISPELLPTLDGQIDQKTEEIVGPYQLNDFFLYHYLTDFYSFKKIYFLAKETFKGIYSDEELKKWLKNFIRRFFSNQFKRSCSPDGVKITQISLSPRGDLRLPSDIDYKIFIKEIEEL